MARSSTTYRPKWNTGKTCVIRVPEAIAEDVLSIAYEIDCRKAGKPVVRENGVEYALEAPKVQPLLDPRKPVNVASVPQRSPFRYPGGKTWLVPFLRVWMKSLNGTPDLFIEPFAGGGIASLTVAFEHLAAHAIMAEIDDGVAAVWMTILKGQGEWLAKEILGFRLNLKNVKAAFAEERNGSTISLRQKAFLTVLRNRVQRGGIMAPGAGLVKTGENNRGIRSRWYPETLARRIREISMNLHRLSFSDENGFALIDQYQPEDRAVFFVDPPYMKAARRLYKNWQIDHAYLFAKLSRVEGDFLMTYDNTEEIRNLADQFGFESRPVKMKNTHHAQMTELLIGRNLEWLDTNGSGYPSV